MPKNISYRPTIIDELITNERLNSYKNVFFHSDDMELVGAYLWNTHVCAALYPLLTVAEVTLRNSIDCALVKSLGNFWWSRGRLHYSSFVPNDPNPPYPVTAIRNNFSKASTQVRNDKRSRYNARTVRPTHHEVISKTEFSTWEFILDSEFMGPRLIWPTNLGAVFRGPWPTSRAGTMLSSTRDLVKTVREFRNRVSHNEPVWKRYGVSTEADAIAHLHEKIDKILELITLVSPEKEELILKNGLVSRARRVCSINELRNCEHKYEVHNVKSVSKLCRIAKKATIENSGQQVVVYKHGKTRFIIQPS